MRTHIAVLTMVVGGCLAGAAPAPVVLPEMTLSQVQPGVGRQVNARLSAFEAQELVLPPNERHRRRCKMDGHPSHGLQPMGLLYEGPFFLH